MIKEERDFNILDWWKKVVLDNYVNFSGRARRSEFWYFTLMHWLIIICLGVLTALLSAIFKNSSLVSIPIILIALYFLATLLPSIAVAVRRLHDTGKSGWWLLAPAIPFVGNIASIVLLVFYCIEGDSFPNDYGLDPKNPNNAIGYSGPYSILNSYENSDRNQR